MAKIKVLTDSTCDLPVAYFRDYDIGVIPINIQFKNDSYQEGVTISQTEFYDKVDELGVIPQTSQPSVGQFVEVYRAIAEQGYDSILSIHVTGKLSGTYNSAVLAAQEVTKLVRVIPYDSLAGSAALGFMCVDAVQLARAGKSVDEILAHLDQKRPHARVFLSLATLKYAEMSGRVSHLQGFVASLMNLKAIISLEEGMLLPSGRVRSRQAALAHLLDLAKEAAGSNPVRFAVIHAQARAEAEQVLEQGLRMMNCTDSFIDDIATSLAVHFGPGVIGTVVYPG